MKTYAVRSPLNTHFRSATCAEIGCPDYLHGWYLKIDGTPENLIYTAKHSGRRYTIGELWDNSGSAFQALIFEAGQECFRSSTHVISLDRPEFFYAGQGDHRSFSTRRAIKFDRPEHFVDSFATHLDRLKQDLERG
jgi:hypothetical protein